MAGMLSSAVDRVRKGVASGITPERNIKSKNGRGEDMEEDGQEEEEDMRSMMKIMMNMMKGVEQKFDGVQGDVSQAKMTAAFVLTAVEQVQTEITKTH